MCWGGEDGEGAGVGVVRGRCWGGEGAGVGVVRSRGQVLGW